MSISPPQMRPETTLTKIALQATLLDQDAPDLESDYSPELWEALRLEDGFLAMQTLRLSLERNLLHHLGGEGYSELLLRRNAAFELENGLRAQAEVALFQVSWWGQQLFMNFYAERARRLWDLITD
ncbi:hypothetical protein N7466_006480 [Penicillium verhagenii]|uniref:uncharacterized protein n=1 Tax=Penicillium verhagenii TaxID=1562060 RepID=UPI0025453D30|nr:uncharacterized protein N7466_006480 [Penicillium verhagenii]KAJ5930987.1 hypothetical protein N7466_006480 [Penicillium verhagenii]